MEVPVELEVLVQKGVALCVLGRCLFRFLLVLINEFRVLYYWWYHPRALDSHRCIRQTNSELAYTGHQLDEKVRSTVMFAQSLAIRPIVSPWVVVMDHVWSNLRKVHKF